jgi:hypothetical protein
MTLESLESLRRELEFVREHNARRTGDELPFAEAALLLMTLERFLRLLPGVNAADKETLPQLLQRAVAIGTLKLPDGETGALIDGVRRFRNALLHANHEQAAGKRKDYFAGEFARDRERFYGLLTDLVRQVNPATGLRY